MTNLLPGSATLGLGFDIFGCYDSSSLKAPLFDFTDYDEDEVQTISGTFIKPFNTHYNPDDSSGRGQSYSFSSRQEFQQHFAAKVKIKGKVGFFRGSFDATFDLNQKIETDYSYGCYEYENTLWTLSITDSSWQRISSNVLDDPDFNNLFNDDGKIKKYSSETAYLFFRFFKKYGCHFVKEVSLGAKLYYWVQVTKAYTKDKMELKAKIELEFKTLLNSAKGEISGGWDKLGKSWAESRETHIEVVGGKNDLMAKLSGITPVFGEETSYKEIYDQWIASVDENPTVIDYQLAPIEELFSGDEAEQIHLASEAYTNTQLTVSSEGMRESIILNGTPLRAEKIESFTSDNSGPTWDSVMHIVVINRQNLEPVFNEAYGFLNNTSRTYEKIYNDLEKYEGKKEYIVVIALRGVNQEEYKKMSNHAGQAIPGSDFMGFKASYVPTAKFYQFLEGCGAEPEQLRRWSDYKPTHAAFYDTLSFAFIGVCGDSLNSAISSQNFGYYIPIGPAQKKVLPVELKILLQPVATGDGKILFKPQEI